MSGTKRRTGERERGKENVRERRMECLMEPFSGEARTPVPENTVRALGKRAELLEYHVCEAESKLYRCRVWQQVPLYIQFVVITPEPTGNMPKYILALRNREVHKNPKMLFVNCRSLYRCHHRSHRVEVRANISIT